MNLEVCALELASFCRDTPILGSGDTYMTLLQSLTYKIDYKHADVNQQTSILATHSMHCAFCIRGILFFIQLDHSAGLLTVFTERFLIWDIILSSIYICFLALFSSTQRQTPTSPDDLLKIIKWCSVTLAWNQAQVKPTLNSSSMVVAVSPGGIKVSFWMCPYKFLAGTSVLPHVAASERASWMKTY